jgi:hypothetical protein
MSKIFEAEQHRQEVAAEWSEAERSAPPAPTDRDVLNLEQLREATEADIPPAAPPPIPGKETASSLIERLAGSTEATVFDQAIADIRSLSRNRCAVLFMLSAFNSQTNLVYQALGELRDEDFAPMKKTLGHLALAVDLLQARLSAIKHD